MSIDIHRFFNRGGQVCVTITDVDGHRTSPVHLSKHQSEILVEIIERCRMYDKRTKLKEDRRAWKNSKKA